VTPPTLFIHGLPCGNLCFQKLFIHERTCGIKERSGQAFGRPILHEGEGRVTLEKGRK